jgi:hypothetical protein
LSDITARLKKICLLLIKMIPVLPITKEAVQTIFNGALGAMTFGAYAQFQTDKIIKLNNQLQEQKLAKLIEERDKLSEKREKEHEKKIEALLSKRVNIW